MNSDPHGGSAIGNDSMLRQNQVQSPFGPRLFHAGEQIQKERLRAAQLSNGIQVHNSHCSAVAHAVFSATIQTWLPTPGGNLGNGEPSTRRMLNRSATLGSR